jgi:hypothetical protein
VRTFTTNDDLKRKFSTLHNEISTKQKLIPKQTQQKEVQKNISNKKSNDDDDYDSGSELDANEKQPPRKKAKHIVSSDDNDSS